jgi:DNA polymerase III subunit epsilon
MFFEKWFKPAPPKVYPEFWNQYLAHFQELIEKKTPFEALSFVVFDTETTGFDIFKDKILSIGAVTIEAGEINVANAFECYIEQNFEDKGSVAIHGIMPNNQYKRISEQAAMESFLGYCQNKILVGHHVGYDVAMVNQALQHLCNDKLKNYAFDTALLYHRLKYPLQQQFNPNEDYTLDALSGEFNISASDRHTASGDAFITAILFMKLLNRLEKQGVRTLQDLLKR